MIKRDMQKYLRHMGIVFGACALCFLFSVISVRAKEIPQKKKVRVAYYNSDNYQEGASETESKSGYSYEYLQKIAAYTSWEYEYVYGEKEELFEQFKAGKIDLFAGLTYDEELVKSLNFPNHYMGIDKYFIFVKNENTDLIGDDISILKGKKIGCLDYLELTSGLEKWIKNTGEDIESVYYPNIESMRAALKNGEIDGFVDEEKNIHKSDDVKALMLITARESYLGVKKGATELLSELNDALWHIRSYEPQFLDNLEQKYLKNNIVNSDFSYLETKWLETNDVLKVGYARNYLPFCAENEEGEVVGIVKDTFEMMMESMGLKGKLKVEFVPYDDFSKMADGLKANEVDVTFPVSGEPWYSEETGVAYSIEVINVPFYIAYTGDFSDKTFERIAMANRPIRTIRQNYAESELINCKSGSECLDAILSGDATCTIMASFRLDALLNDEKYSDISKLPYGESMSYSIGIRKGDATMMSLMNRGLVNVDKSVITNILYSYLQDDSSYTIKNFLRANALVIVILIAVICGIIIVMSIMYVRGVRAAERETQKAFKLAEQANAAKTSFLFNMSHDIRTPMNAIIGFTELIEKNQDDEVKRGRYLQKIKESSGVLLSIINNVLEMARIEKGTVLLEEEPVCLDEFNDSFFAMFVDMMKQKDIIFTREVNVEHKYIMSDVPKIREVFLNLFSNAYKYTNKGGRVHVRTEELPSDKDGYALLRTTVSDTGIGMAPEFVPKIFEEFSREQRARDERIEGTGLGMSIVKRLLELMGGTIEVNSKLGIGTTVVVTMYHKISSKEELFSSQNAENAPVSFGGNRILLAEDNELNAEIAAEILKEAGFIIDWVDNGQKCLEKLVQANPGYYDLILMDIQMPVMNGYEAARAIRDLGDKQKANIPIVAMTANAFSEDIKQAFDSGMNAHLSKPVVIKDLLNTMEEMLSRN